VIERSRLSGASKEPRWRSKRAGRSATRHESLQPRQIYNEGAEPLISRRRQHSTLTGDPDMPLAKSLPGYGESATVRTAWFGTGEPVCAASSAKAVGISQW